MSYREENVALKKASCSDDMLEISNIDWDKDKTLYYMTMGGAQCPNYLYVHETWKSKDDFNNALLKGEMYTLFSRLKVV